ncbi:MAG: alanine racemase [Steroidobacteraceae bacterium]
MAAGQRMRPGRPAWVEVDLAALGANLRLIRADLPAAVRLMHVIKDEAYGAGAIPVARMALTSGVDSFATYTVAEAVALRDAGIEAPILLLGERTALDFDWLCSHRLIPCVGSLEVAAQLEAFAAARDVVLDVHLKINSGMNRYGFSWRAASRWVAQLAEFRHLRLAGALTHFAQSDELDKRFALQQLGRFQEVLRVLSDAGLTPGCIHACNSGGFLDLPQAHHDMVRVGILALGVYPSAVCRRIPGLSPVLTVKATITALQELEPGDVVGYGMHFRAESRRRIAVLPIGYGDGYPRVRNEGHALLRGRRVPLVGGVSMDALTVDVTDVPEAALGDEMVLMGRQGEEDITPHELAALKRSVSYDILTNWRARLPRHYLGGAR